MSPTINPGDGAIGDEVSYRLGAQIERFDIVVFKAPKHPTMGSTDEYEVKYVFRVIGLSGEKVEIRKGVVWINDRVLEEPFEKIPDERGFLPIVIPENEYFLLGDNRPNSWDGRDWVPGTIRKEDIYGEVVKILPGYYKE